MIGAIENFVRLSVWASVLCLATSASAQVSMPVHLNLQKSEIRLPYGDREVAIRLAWPKGVSVGATGIIVDVPGYPLASATLGEEAWANYDQWVGIAYLNAGDEFPAVFFEAYSAGAHCCSILTAITPSGGRLRVIEFERAEGEIRAELPFDIDGDGILDIVREGEHRCGSDSDCFTRTAIYNIQEGRAVDVTDAPKFQPFLDELSRSVDVRRQQ